MHRPTIAGQAAAERTTRLLLASRAPALTLTCALTFCCDSHVGVARIFRILLARHVVHCRRRAMLLTRCWTTARCCCPSPGGEAEEEHTARGGEAAAIIGDIVSRHSLVRAYNDAPPLNLCAARRTVPAPRGGADAGNRLLLRARGDGVNLTRILLQDSFHRNFGVRFLRK